jgi:hypothetical protein
MQAVVTETGHPSAMVHSMAPSTVARMIVIAGLVTLAALGIRAPPLQGAEISAVSDAHDTIRLPGEKGHDSASLPKSSSIDGVAGALVDDLIAWIEAATDYDVSRTRNDPPQVRFAESGEAITYDGASLAVRRDVRALYDRRTRTIYLIRPWNERAVTDVSSLLHELVHDVQFLNHQWLCVNETEKQAYELQARWLKERHATARFNWVQIAILSRCFGSVHP